MEIETKYAVGLFFPNPSFLQIYYESVANALDAGATHIEISIDADGHIDPDHLEIFVKDNGVGFTDERFDRFARLKEPTDPHHKGLGRLVYLRYFSRVSIESVFDDTKRSFTFSEDFRGENSKTPANELDEPGTTLRFHGFLGSRLKSYDYVKPASLKERLLGHFLPYLHERKESGEDFKIVITLKTQAQDSERLYPDTKTIEPKDIPLFKKAEFQDVTIDAFATFTMWYLIREGEKALPPFTAACIDGRTLPINLLRPSAIPPEFQVIFLFKSDLFRGMTDSSRQRLALPDSISEAELFRALRRELSVVLNEELPAIEQRNNATKKRFEERYPHLMGLFEEDTVGIIDRDEALEIAQRRFFAEQKAVLESDSLDDATFEKSLEVSSRTLTEYILYRELIIKKLAEISAEDKESSVHDLIIPRYTRLAGSNLAEGLYRNNAWLLDDKFMSFRTILSEARMQEVVSAITLREESAGGDGRPDISMIFSADPDQEEKADVVVVELKRRTTNEKDNSYAINQLLSRARKLREHCPNIQRVWYFAIIEIDEALSQMLEDGFEFAPLFSKGTVYYRDFQIKIDNDPMPTPTYVLSFDAVIQDAAARNHTFLEILKKDVKRVKNA